MSWELPSVGDRAEIAQVGPCGHESKHAVMLVTRIILVPQDFMCSFCEQVWVPGRYEICLDDTVPQHAGGFHCYPRIWLRKLPPLAEPVTVEEAAEV